MTFGDYSEPGRTMIQMASGAQRSFDMDRGTYQDLLRQWDDTLAKHITVVTLGGRECNLRSRDVTRIDFQPRTEGR